MQKPLALSIAACLGLAGCQVFQKSEAWKEAVSVRPGTVAHDPDPSHAYAEKLHTALVDRGIEHKVITYQYRYTTRLREEAVGTRTAVVYRDEKTTDYPWWLKDDRLNTPFWLPNGSLDKQVSFYIRRKAEVIEEQGYPGQGSAAKSALVFAKPIPGLRSPAKPAVAVAAVEPKPAPAVAEHKPAPTIVARKPEPAKVPAPAVATVKPAAVKPIAVVKPVAPKPAAAMKPVPAKPKPAVVVTRKPVVAPTAPKKVVAKREPAYLPPRKFANAPVKKKPTPQPALAQKPVAKVKPAATIASRGKTQSRPLPPVTSRQGGTRTIWDVPGVLDSKEQTSMNAPRDSHLERLFKRKHGTDYNRFSPTDRRKMQALQQGVASRE